MKLKAFLIAIVSAIGLLLRFDTSDGCGPDYEESDFSFSLFNNSTINRPDLTPFFLSFHAVYKETNPNPYSRPEEHIPNDDAVVNDWLECLGHSSDIGFDPYNAAPEQASKKSEFIQPYQLREVVFEMKPDVLREIKLYTQQKPNRLGLSAFRYQFDGPDETPIKKDPQTNNFTGLEFYNSFVQYLYDNKALDILDYLIFLKEMRLPEASTNSWGIEYLEKESGGETCLEQAKAAEKLYKQTSREFLRVRLTYLIVKIYHRYGLYAEAVSAFDRFMPKDAAKTLIYYWALGYKAGALKYMGKKAESAYYFAQVFANCPTNRESAFLSWSVKTAEEWDQAFALCRTNAEKVGLHALRGISIENDAIAEIENIYRIDPKSEFLELLMLREISKAEMALLERSSMLEYKSYTDFHWKERNFSVQNMERLGKICDRFASEGLAQKPYLWKLAAGYTEFLRGRLSEAASAFEAAETMIEAQKKLIQSATKLKEWESWDDNFVPYSLNKVQKETYSGLLYSSLQLKLLRVALHVRSLNSITEKDETEIFEMISQSPSDNLLNNSKNSLLEYILDDISKKYFAQKDFAKAFLCLNSVESLRSNPRLVIIDQLLALLRKDSLNDFEEYLFGKSGLGNQTGLSYSNSKGLEPATAVSLFKNVYFDLLELRGTALIAAGRFAEAADCLAEIPKAYYKKLEYFYLPTDPFRGYVQHVKEYYPDRKKIDRSKALTKLDYAKRMADLIKISQAGIGNTAKQDMEIANALYNTSYYGACWQARCYYRPSYLWTEGELDDTDSQNPFGVYDYDDADTLSYLQVIKNREVVHRRSSGAADMFRKAMAGLRTDEERAECVFMLAKCEQVEFYTSKDYENYVLKNDSDNIKLQSILTKYKTNFELLRTRFAHTSFYKYARENCLYFNDYCN